MSLQSLYKSHSYPPVDSSIAMASQVFILHSSKHLSGSFTPRDARGLPKHVVCHDRVESLTVTTEKGDIYIFFKYCNSFQLVNGFEVKDIFRITGVI